ncbi:MAG TPA: iron-containing redox enzyme family protein [Kofleriaceae bacterium]|nr:iron-containing redox enzyme family protein [Kofleriaceae bacterium]
MTAEQSNPAAQPAASPARSPLGAASRPLLRSEVQLSRADDDLIAAAPDTEYAFHGASAAALAPIAHQLDASLTVEELAGRAGVTAAELAATLDVLAADGLVIDLQEAFENPTPARFLELYLQVCKSWSTEFSSAQFWSELMSGATPPAVVLGWGIETYHYVESANEHMAASVAYCRNDTVVRRWFAQHYVEEHDHGRIFLDGLEACGLIRDQIRAAPPLASTRALINFLVELATNDSLAYAGTYGVMRGGSSIESKDVTKLCDKLTSQYGYATGLVEAIRAHSAEDVGLDHNEIVLARWLKKRGHVSPDDAQRILRAARGMADHFVLFFEGIRDYYGTRGALVPRRPCDARWLTV